MSNDHNLQVLQLLFSQFSTHLKHISEGKVESSSAQTGLNLELHFATFATTASYLLHFFSKTNKYKTGGKIMGIRDNVEEKEKKIMVRFINRTPNNWPQTG